jgi:hypothetical protein
MNEKCRTCGSTESQIVDDARTLGLLKELQSGIYTCCQIVVWADEQWLAWIQAAEEDGKAVDDVTTPLESAEGEWSALINAAHSGRIELNEIDLTLIVFAVRLSGQSNPWLLVDASDSFDPVGGAKAEIDLHQLLWIRCGRNAEHALKATDLVGQAGGFGMVLLDLDGVAPIGRRRHTSRNCVI